MITHSCETSKLLAIYYNFVSILIDTYAVDIRKVLFVVCFIKMLITKIKQKLIHWGLIICINLLILLRVVLFKVEMQ